MTFSQLCRYATEDDNGFVLTIDVALHSLTKRRRYALDEVLRFITPKWVDITLSAN